MATATMSSAPETTPGRPLIVGSESPEHPFPVRAKGVVIPGFQRGSKQLGIPTANLPQDVADKLATDVQSGSGIYYGWASVGSKPEVLPMVMSVGWNPFYKNEKRTAEVHIMHKFPEDFYDEELRIVVVGYIREEKNYESLGINDVDSCEGIEHANSEPAPCGVDALILDIRTDVVVAENSLARPDYSALRNDPFLAPSCL